MIHPVRLCEPLQSGSFHPCVLRASPGWIRHFLSGSLFPFLLLKSLIIQRVKLRYFSTFFGIVLYSLGLIAVFPVAGKGRKCLSHHHLLLSR